MKILLDHCVPKRLRKHLPKEYEIKTAFEMGWASLKDRSLLDAAESGFDLILTTDQNLPHQQNIIGREIGVIILVASSNRLDDLLPLLPYLAAEIKRIHPGQFMLVEEPEASPEITKIAALLKMYSLFEEDSTLDIELWERGAFRVKEVKHDLSSGKEVVGHLRLSGAQSAIIFSEVPELNFEQAKLFHALWQDVSKKIQDAEKQDVKEIRLMRDGDYPELFFPLDTYQTLHTNLREGMVQVWQSIENMLEQYGYEANMFKGDEHSAIWEIWAMPFREQIIMST